MIYIKEAHACDEWKLGNRICIKQHKTVEERQNAAIEMIKELNFEIPTYLDSIDNSFEELFAVWPERYVLIDPKKENEVLFISYPEKYGHSPYRLEQSIEGYLNK
ncbi:hypothetical protein ABK040_008464 [Willaertia magna]